MFSAHIILFRTVLLGIYPRRNIPETNEKEQSLTIVNMHVQYKCSAEKRKTEIMKETQISRERKLKIALLIEHLGGGGVHMWHEFLICDISYKYTDTHRTYQRSIFGEGT